MHDAIRSRLCGLVLATLAGAALVTTARPADGQSIDNLTVTANPGSCADAVTTADPRGERRTVGAIQSTSATAFTTRLSEVVAADGDTSPGVGSESCAVDYRIQFDVTSPAKYVLVANTRLRGALTLVDDGGGQATASLGGVTGTQSGGTLILGTLDLAGPGTVAGASGGNLPFNVSSNSFQLPRIEGASHGVPQTHSLDFTFTGSCASEGAGSAPGDECAVRLGERATYPAETASDYPGAGTRVQTDDGHFVTLELHPAPPNDECTTPIVVTTTPFLDVRDTIGATSDPSDPFQTCSGAPQASPRQNSNSVWYALTAPSNGEIIVDTVGSDYDTVLTGHRGACGSLVQQGCSDDWQIPGRTSRIDIVVTAGTTYLFDITDFASPHGGTLRVSIVFDPDCGNGFLDTGEQCDDGAANGTVGSSCTADCTIRPAPGGDCGNGTLDAGEECDQGAGNGTRGSCCTAECRFRPAVTPCRPPVGVCDAPEVCSGTSGACPADAKSTAVCREAAGGCDAPESCDGVNNTCPADAFLTAGTVCRPAAGNCDVPELCTGLGPGCPLTDNVLPAGTPCRSASGECDLAEQCTGASGVCPPDGKHTTECRASAGVCDLADSCDGVTDTCPADAKSTAECRASEGACDPAESCDGTADTCPVDAKSTGECRSVAGPCDRAEQCDGVANDCPADAFATGGSECRATTDFCDPAEQCSGTSADCPVDAFLPDGTSCDDADVCTAPDLCVEGSCVGEAVGCGDGTLQASCGEECDDGNHEDGDGCSASCTLEPCGPAPAAGCRRPVVAGKASLHVRDRTPDRRDRVLWKWVKGAATTKAAFGDPLTSTEYALCLYDGGDQLRASAVAPAGGLCDGRPCWRENRRGFKYRARGLGGSGLKNSLQMLLKEGSDGSARILVTEKGESIAIPALPLAQPVTVQLQSSAGECWEASYGAPAKRNDATEFRDKAD